MDRKKWKEWITGLKKESRSGEKSRERLKEAIITAVLERKGKKNAVLFSGGVDSSFISLILKKNNVPFTCYTVGFKEKETKEPEDLIWARKAGNILDVEVKEIILSLKEVKEIIIKILKEWPDIDIVNLGVMIVEFAGAEKAKQDGCDTIYGGLGSEEIFGGYERHRLSENINEECWNGLLNMYERDMIRENKISAIFNIKGAAPFLDEKVIVEAMRFPSETKIKNNVEKFLLREIAKEYGLNREIAERKKRAAQYGSRTDSAILKLARRRGLKKKKELLEQLKKAEIK